MADLHKMIVESGRPDIDDDASSSSSLYVCLVPDNLTDSVAALHVEPHNPSKSDLIHHITSPNHVEEEEEEEKHHDDDDDDDAEKLSDDSCTFSTESSNRSLMDRLTCQTDTLLLACMTIMVLAFLVVPIVGAMSLHILYDYNSVLVPNHLTQYFGWVYSEVSTNSITDVLRVFSYYGAYTPTFSTAMATASADFVDSLAGSSSSSSSSSSSRSKHYTAEEQTFRTEAKSAMDMTNAYIGAAISVLSDIADLPIASANIEDVLDGFDALQTTTVVSFSRKVLKQQRVLANGVSQRTLIDPLTRSVFTVEQVNDINRVVQLTQSLQLACFELPTCWGGDGRAVVEAIETAAGRLVAGLMTIILDVLQEIENPVQNATNRYEAITENLLHINTRLELLTQASTWLQSLEAVVQPLESDDVASLSDGQKTVLFITTGGWPAALMEAATKSVDVASNVSTFYANNTPVKKWLEGYDNGVFNVKLNETQIISAASVYHSFFAANIGVSLDEVGVSSTEEDAIAAAYEAVPITAQLTALHDQVHANQHASFNSINAFVKHEVAHLSRSITSKIAITVSASAVLSFLAAVALAIVVRHRIAASPLPFSHFLVVLTAMYVVQLFVAVWVGHIAATSPSRPRAMSEAYTYRTTARLYRTITASNAVSAILKDALLIAEGETQAVVQVHANIKTVMDLLDHNEGVWVESLRTFASSALEMYRSGFYPMRQQMSSATSLGLTMSALLNTFNISTFADAANGAAFTMEDDGCRAILAAGLLSYISTNFVDLTAVVELLGLGTKRVGEVLSAATTQGMFHGLCATANTAGTADPSTRCFIASMCGDPSSTFGLLRAVAGPSGLYQIFDPTSASTMGTFLEAWDQLANRDLMAEIQQQYNYLAAAASADLLSSEEVRREVVWYSVFTCIFLEVGAIVLWRLLATASSSIIL